MSIAKNILIKRYFWERLTFQTFIFFKELSFKIQPNTINDKKEFLLQHYQQ